MSSMNIRRSHVSLLAISGLLVLSGCATESPSLRDEEPDLTNVSCANGEPLACVEKIGKKVDCTCESLEALKRMVEDGLRHW